MKAVLLLVICLLAMGTGRSQKASAEAPNVILILTDDQGYGDLACHGNPYIKTPALDRLYKESVRFTDYHVDPTCAPTRAALMTGKYSHHVGVWHTIAGGNHLRPTETTMARVFKDAGYRTGLFGKWHLGSNYPYRPVDRGFDEWLGHGDGGTGTTDDWFYNDRVNDYYWHNGEREQREGYAPDVFYEAAMAFIKASKKRKMPFFVYLPTYLPHDPHTLPAPLKEAPYGRDVSKAVSYFYSGIERIDYNIGRLRNILEALGEAENTIIVFMSDNGGTAGVKLFNAGMRGKKGSVYDGGHRVPLFVHWPKGGLRHGSDVNELTAHIDILPTLIDLCQIQLGERPDFDGRSFKKQLFDPETKLPERTLFVETQRTFRPVKGEKVAGMTGHWRWVNDKELYNVKKDPGQTKNVIDDYPALVEKFRKDYEAYWKKVSPHDRDQPVFIIGHGTDPETYLTSSDWHLPKVPWNHAQVAEGSMVNGSWKIAIAEEGLYRFEARRWPREAKAPIQGIPSFREKKVDAWTAAGPVDKLIYGRTCKPLAVKSVSLQVGELEKTLEIDNPNDSQVIFDLELKKGTVNVKATMRDDKKEPIGGIYYLYITKL